MPPRKRVQTATPVERTLRTSRSLKISDPDNAHTEGVPSTTLVAAPRPHPASTMRPTGLVQSKTPQSSIPKSVAPTTPAVQPAPAVTQPASHNVTQSLSVPRANPARAPAAPAIRPGLVPPQNPARPAPSHTAASFPRARPHGTIPSTTPIEGSILSRAAAPSVQVGPTDPPMVSATDGSMKAIAMQVNSLGAQVKSLEVAEKNTQAQLKQQKAENDSLRGKLVAVEARITQLEDELAQAIRTIQALQEEIMRLVDERANERFSTKEPKEQRERKDAAVLERVKIIFAKMQGLKGTTDPCQPVYDANNQPIFFIPDPFDPRGTLLRPDYNKGLNEQLAWKRDFLNRLFEEGPTKSIPRARFEEIGEDDLWGKYLCEGAYKSSRSRFQRVEKSGEYLQINRRHKRKIRKIERRTATLTATKTLAGNEHLTEVGMASSEESETEGTGDEKVTFFKVYRPEFRSTKMNNEIVKLDQLTQKRSQPKKAAGAAVVTTDRRYQDASSAKERLPVFDSAIPLSALNSGWLLDHIDVLDPNGPFKISRDIQYHPEIQKSMIMAGYLRNEPVAGSSHAGLDSEAGAELNAGGGRGAGEYEDGEGREGETGEAGEGEGGGGQTGYEGREDDGFDAEGGNGGDGAHQGESSEDDLYASDQGPRPGKATADDQQDHVMGASSDRDDSLPPFPPPLETSDIAGPSNEGGYQPRPVFRIRIPAIPLDPALQSLGPATGGQPNRIGLSTPDQHWNHPPALSAATLQDYAAPRMPPPPLASNLGPKYHPATPVDSAGPSESSTPPAKRARKAVVTSGGPPGIAQTRSKRKTRAPK